MGVYRRKLSRGVRFYYAGQYLNVKYFSRAIFHTKSEAAKAERAKRDEIDEQARNPQIDMRLWDLIQARLDDLNLKKSKKYYRENRRYFKMLYEHVGNVNVTEVTKPQIISLLAHYAKQLSKNGRTNHKVNAMLRYLKALFNHAIKVYDLDFKNPCVGLEFYPIDKKLKKIPTDQEIGAVRELFDDEECLLFNFVLETGARIGEALRFRYLDLAGENIVLYTRKSKNSNLIPRKVPCPRCLNGLQFTGRLFKRWSETAGQPRFLEKRLKEIGQSPWSWHNLRHRYASRLSKEGRPLFEIMSLLGHSNLSTTQNYLQLLP